MGSTVYPIPGNPTSANFNFTISSDITNAQITPCIRFNNAAGSNIQTLGYAAMTTSPKTYTPVITGLSAYLSAGATNIRLQIINSNATGSGIAHTVWSGNVTYLGCSNPTTPYVPPVVISPPSNIPNPPALPTGCTTDQLCAKLTYIEQELDVLARLLARNPTLKWKDGAIHSNLRDSGRISLAPGALGVRAVITTVPTGPYVAPGDPPFHYDLGFITPLALGVALRGQRLVFNPQDFALPAQADGVAYTLLHGTVMNLVELIPLTA
jgi:hypothetical protein